VESAVLRLRWVCVICACITILSVVLQRYLQPEIAVLMRNPVIPLTWLGVVLIALGIGALQQFRLLAPATILNLGLVFEVMVSFAMSFAETSLQLVPDGLVLGVPKVSVWIAVVGLLIPNRPRIKLITALISASSWPICYFLNLHLHGFEPLAVNRLVAWIYVPYVMAFATYALSWRVSFMERAAQRAQDLGSYELVSLIGSGGMGEVWLARHRMLARDAAIKLIRPDLITGQSGHQLEITRKRFEREARAIASLQSPHTVYLFDFGVSQEGTFYYVMELLDGISLELLVEKFGPQPASRVVHILRQVCESLEEAHRHGLIHRDVKPSNIFICTLGIERDFAKVLDFGLVKNVSPKESMRLTIDGTSAGTPAYMAPEVAMGEPNIDGRVDLYGLGCVAYFLLTGVPVFDEKTPTAAALAHVQKPPTPPSQRTELPVPPELEQIILQCLAKKPDDRPHSAQELGRMLTRCAGVAGWDQETAARWWETYLPSSSSYRVVRQPQAPAQLMIRG
jgi:serine/threonine-protein kinase